MMTFECPRCGYDTSNLDSFKKHLQRKKVCKAFKEDVSLDLLKLKYLTQSNCHSCINCRRVFSTKYGLTKHLRVCVPTESTRAMQPVVVNITNNITNNHITTNITNNIVIINPLGNESNSHISNDFMLDCVKRKVEGLCEYIAKKHFDAEHPENTNIKVEGDDYLILDLPIFNHRDNIKEKKPYNGCFWLRLNKKCAIEDNILPRLETAFRMFFQTYPIEQIDTKYISEFVQDIVLPLEWSMNLDCEDDYDAPIDSSTKDMICQCIDKKISSLKS